MASITLYVRGKARPLSMQERVAAAKAQRGKHTVTYVWPVPVPEYGKGEAATARRTQNYWDAVGECDDMADAIAREMAAGHRVTVEVETGAVLTRDYTIEPKIYANVVAPQLLRELAELADVVKIHADAEDPRAYVAEETGTEA